MCLKINKDLPKDLDCIVVKGVLYRKGIKKFYLSYSYPYEDLEYRIEQLLFDNKLFSPYQAYFYNYDKCEVGLIFYDDSKIQKVQIAFNNETYTFEAKLGYHGRYLQKNSCYKFKQAEFEDFMENIHWITVPILIEFSKIQLSGVDNEIVFKEFIIPKDNILKECFPNNEFNYDYSKFYNRLLF